MPETASCDSLTVIIPTYNRQQVLAKALAGYLAQTSPHLVHELLVVDDGSTDSTEAMVRDISARAPIPIRYLRQPNKGPAAARNFGIREARSDLILFTDSDIIPERDLVERHIDWHRNNPDLNLAALGYVTWSPELRITPFMRWYGEEQLFDFKTLRRKQEASYRHFYTCNVSLKTAFLRSYGQFDEDFKTAAFEDTDLGYRLIKNGLRLFYDAEAIAYHHQSFSFADACRKAKATTAAATLFFSKESGHSVIREVQQKQSHMGNRIARRMAIGVAIALTPFRMLLDSSVPMPRIVYHLFFWNDATRLTKQFRDEDEISEDQPSTRQESTTLDGSRRDTQREAGRDHPFLGVVSDSTRPTEK